LSCRALASSTIVALDWLGQKPLAGAEAFAVGGWILVGVVNLITSANVAEICPPVAEVADPRLSYR
jgi:hypothetical protein